MIMLPVSLYVVLFLLYGIECNGFVAYPAFAIRLLALTPHIHRLPLATVLQSRRKTFHVRTQFQQRAASNSYDGATGETHQSTREGDDDEDDDEDDDAGDDEDEVENEGLEDTWDDHGNPASSLINDSEYDIVDRNLRQLCSKGFTHDFIGVLMADIGVPCPIDFDARIGDYMTGEQIFTMMESLSSLDPFDANEEISSCTMYQLAHVYKLSEKKVKFICEKERINLPFAMWTCLHESVEEHFIEAVESGKYDGFEDDRYIPNMPDIDEVVSTMTEAVAAAQRGGL